MATIAATNGVCTQTGCKIAEGGACLEGLSLDICPHFQSVSTDVVATQETAYEDDEDENDEDSVQNVPLAPTWFVPSGAELTLSEAAETMGGALSRLIVVAGDSDGGKTTLLSTLFEQFNRGPFAGWACSWCRTLPAFEKICHTSRRQSGHTKPQTEHTQSSNEPYFLHLRLCREGELEGAQLPRPIDLLLANVSGEDFEQMRNSQEFAKRSTYLRRADHVVIVLDGEKLARRAHRHQPLPSAVGLLSRLQSVGHLGSHALVHVVFSKWDELETPQTPADADAAECRKFVLDMEEDLTREFEGKFGGLHFHQVSARPYLGSSVTEGFGMGLLLESWMTESKLLQPSGTLSSRVAVCEPRESGRFVWPPPKG